MAGGHALRRGARDAVHVLLAALCVAASASDDRTGDRRWVGMPNGDVFAPLIADPKTPQSLASALWGQSGGGRSTLIGAVAFGDDIGLVRWPGPREGEGIQVGLAGAVFAQFDLRATPVQMLNADFLIGLPVTFRRGAWSARARLYHQSSHLGDQYLIAQPRPRLALAFEAVELLAAAQTGGVRVYGGGEWIFHSEIVLPELVWHAGLEYRLPPRFRLTRGIEAQLVSGVDAKRPWVATATADLSVRAGFEFGPPAGKDGWRRRWAVLLHYFDGNSPFGQFYASHASFAGVGLHFFL